MKKINFIFLISKMILRTWRSESISVGLFDNETACKNNSCNSSNANLNIYIYKKREDKSNIDNRNNYSSSNRVSSVVVCDRRLDKRCEYLSLFANHLRNESSAWFVNISLA